jgi:LacI family transcriptional regulator
MNTKATLKNIANQLGISISTVSRALKDHPDISKETKRKVRELADLMDFEPNAFAVYLRTNQSKVIGLIVPELSNFFYHSFVAAVEEEARKKGFSLIILQSGNDPAVEEANLKLCKLNRVAGIFVALTSETRDLSPFDRIRTSGIPILFFDKVPDENNCIKICIADRDVGKLAARTIIESGRKKVFALFGNPNLSITRKRKQGLVDELKTLSPFIEINTVTVNNSEEARSATTEMLNSYQRAEVIFCMSDEILTGVIMAINRSGLSIPDDIGILTISNGFIPKLVHPEITYIETSGAHLGKRAMKTFIEVLEKGITKKNDIIEGKLIKGGSL